MNVFPANIKTFMSVTGRAKSLVTDKQHRLHLRGERDPIRCI